MLDDVSQQLMTWIYSLLVSKPVDFVFAHGLVLGVVSGAIAGIPFKAKRIIHVVVLFLGVIASLYIYQQWHLTLAKLFFSTAYYFIAEMLGNYIIGCIGGFIIANTIQRVRGEHDHVTNN